MSPFDPKSGLPEPKPKPEDGAQAALHALSALDADAARAFEARVDDEPALEAEVLALRAAAEALAPLVREVAPPPALLQRVLTVARNTPATGKSGASDAAATPFSEEVRQWRSTGAAAVRFMFGSEGDFRPLRVAGISARTLHRDDAAGYATVIVRMQPGSSYPAHRHGDDEECYVLEGDLQVGDATMQAGDYQIARRGSVHPTQMTRGGCVLLLRSSLHDELLEAV